MNEEKMNQLEEEAVYIIQQLRLSCSDERGNCIYDDDLKELMNIMYSFTAEIRKYKWAKSKHSTGETMH